MRFSQSHDCGWPLFGCILFFLRSLLRKNRICVMTNKQLAFATFSVCILIMISSTISAAETKVPVKFSEGHEIGKNDFGRPITLMAAALGVKPEVFRKAFSGVTPARGREP